MTVIRENPITDSGNDQRGTKKYKKMIEILLFPIIFSEIHFMYEEAQLSGVSSTSRIHTLHKIYVDV